MTVRSDLGFYLDEHMSRKIAKRLIERGYRVVRAVDVGHIIDILAEFIALFDEARDAGQVHWLK